MADEAKDTVNHLMQYHGDRSVWGSSPVEQAWYRNSIAYFNHILEPDSWESSLSFQGVQGELVKMLVPEARSLIRQLVTLITKQKLAFRGIAQASGSEIMSTIRLANNLSDQIVSIQNLDIKGERLTELALVYGNAYIKATWRTDKGDIFTAQKNKLEYTGDVGISVHDVWNVFYDYSIESWDDQNWVEVRTLKNRWDLIKQFPKLKSEIMSVESSTYIRGPYYSDTRSVSDDDMIYVYEVYHKPSPSLPKGRMIFYSDDKTIYFDGDNLYEDLPVYEMKPAPIFGMGFGSPAYSELLPSQEMLNNSFSAIATNQSAFAVQSVMIPRNSGVSMRQIDGMNFIEFNPQTASGGGKPEALQLTKSPPEVFNFIDLCKSSMQGLSGLNSAVRGQPPPGVTSGTAIATLTTNALEFISSTARTYTKAMEQCMEGAINGYRKFAKVPRMIFMNGRNDQIVEREFIGTDLDPIKKIELTLSNPLMQTIAGRSDLAEKMVSSGLIKNVQDYITILEGGSLSSLYKTEASENDLIESENEKLMEGEDVIVLSTDDHPVHIRQHAGLLNDTNIRNNAESMEIILNHILEHRQQATLIDPILNAMVRTGKMPEGAMPPEGGPPAPGQGMEGQIPPDQLTTNAPAKPAQPTEDLLGRA